jgi:hypothetical protein
MTCDSSEVFSEYFSFPTNKTDRHDITEILLNVTLNTLTTNPAFTIFYM